MPPKFRIGYLNIRDLCPNHRINFFKTLGRSNVIPLTVITLSRHLLLRHCCTQYRRKRKLSRSTIGEQIAAIYTNSTKRKARLSLTAHLVAPQHKISAGMMLWVPHENEMSQFARLVMQPLKWIVGPYIAVYDHERIAPNQRKCFEYAAGGLETAGLFGGIHDINTETGTITEILNNLLTKVCMIDHELPKTRPRQSLN